MSKPRVTVWVDPAFRKLLKTQYREHRNNLPNLSLSEIKSLNIKVLKSSLLMLKNVSVEWFHHFSILYQ